MSWPSWPHVGVTFTRRLDLLDRSLEANSLNIKALNLKVAALRHSEPRSGGKYPVAGKMLEALALATRKSDPLDVRVMAERWLMTNDPQIAHTLVATTSAHPGTATETAAEYQGAGLWDDGLAVLSLLVDQAPDRSRVSPMLYYDLAYFADKLGQSEKAAAFRKTARGLSPDYVFPFQSEAIEVLEAAMTADPNDSRAPYYLGNLLYDWQPERAVELWEKAGAIDPSLGMVHRNLAIAWSNRQAGNDLPRATAEMEKAVAPASPPGLFFRELDDLYRATGAALEKRLTMLEKHHELVAENAEAFSREIALLVFAGRYDEAIALMTGRRFVVWEGGRLTVVGDWKTAHLLRGLRHLREERASEAIADFTAAGQVPDNLPSDEGGGDDHKAEIAFLMGQAYTAQGDNEKARKAWEAAVASDTSGGFRGRRSGFGGATAERFSRALALRKLGKANEAVSDSPRACRSGASADSSRPGRPIRFRDGPASPARSALVVPL